MRRFRRCDRADDRAYQIAEAHAYRAELDQAFAWLDLRLLCGAHKKRPLDGAFSVLRSNRAMRIRGERGRARELWTRGH
jgi:hypothetical protein